MVVPFRTFAVFSLAFGMLAAGYLIGPAPGATQRHRRPHRRRRRKPRRLRPRRRCDCPTGRRCRSSGRSRRATSRRRPCQDSARRRQAAATDPTAALTTDQPSPEDADAKRAIEFDGYKNVHAVVKGSDGIWHARAMRGRTEIAVTVDASGNVSAD